jgi:phosphatidyl-myo-inositol dimannoside synthase
MRKGLALVTDAYGGQGGIAQAARDLIGALASQECICSIRVLPRQSNKQVDGIPPKVFQAKPSVDRMLYAARAILEAVRSRPDFIFCNHLYMAPLAALAARLCGSRLLIQLHGIEIWEPPTTVRRAALEAADLVVCVSRDTRARALTHCDLTPERAVVINNTFDPQFKPGDRAEAREKFGLGDEFVLLIVGRLASSERYKGHDKIIEAMPQLVGAHGREVVFLVAGTGDDLVPLEALAASKGVSHRVRFLGHVPWANLPDLYRSADLFVLPSSGEGFGIVFLEAMASGTPAIGLAVGGARDALGDSELGYCVNAHAFANALHQAINTSKINPRDMHEDIVRRFGKSVFQSNIKNITERIMENNTVN